MVRYQPTVFRSWRVGLVLLVITSSQVVAQAQQGGPRLASVVVAEHAWSAPSRTRQPNVSDSVFQSRAHRSAARTLATHAVVGTGAGLIIGLVLSGASASEERTSVVVTWTALGAAAGVASGVVTLLVGRPQ